MTNEMQTQMELGFSGNRPATRIARREQRRNRAAWWFNQMRRVVDSAIDWEPVNDFQPEQTWLPGALRHHQG